MTPDERQAKEAMAAGLAALDADTVHLGIFDYDATFRHKRVRADKAIKLAAQGYPFCDVLYAWDTAEVTYGRGVYADRPAILDPASLRRWPFGERAAVCIADFAAPFGEVSPRLQLSRLIAQAADMGFDVHSAFEFEWFLLDETPDTLRAKSFRDLNFFAKANRTYSLPTMAVHGDLFEGLEAAMTALDIHLDAIHTELGPGCIETPLTHAEGLKAADDAALFKNFAKAFFLGQGLMATFMSKLTPDLPGQSGHFHISLTDKVTGAPIFADPSAPDGLSRTARHFIGGLVTLLPEWLVLCSHTVNAYRRMVPGMWAPTAATWGVQNRSAAVRIINDTPAATRVEFRVPSADTNPHAASCLCLGAGLWGIANEIEPPAGSPDCFDDIDMPPEAQFPATLGEAARRFAASDVAREVFGDAFVESYARARLHEDIVHRRQVTDWEIRRYIEVV